MKVLLTVLVVILGLLGVAELFLRSRYGFGNPLVYIADEKIGYLLAPNQKTRRMGNRIEINQYSMRSASITPKRDPSALRVLLLGDSIVNGGWWTDQNQTISEILWQQLRTKLPESAYTQVEVLNASANSWCPRNQVAYLEQFGTFEAQTVVLVINTDDLFGTAPTSIPVGRDRFYPDRKPPLAIVEAVTRILPYKPPTEMADVNAEGGDRVGANLEAIGKIQALVTSSGGQLLLLMTPLLREIGEPGPRDYELKARARLTKFTQTQGIKYIDFLPIFNNVSSPEILYRDHIHLSPEGNQLVSEAINQQFQHSYFNLQTASTD
ncbi:SGNH/GDSL hydrolase family protein [Desertifilum sp. FACHB-1129]|uniref:Lipolytic protein G-D-S-L family n=1 Tax=Desertifilum tharense IPPAS B-1220 TaxID=1781255 RepID=A0A1E5QL44_9CYAN|nr:MULTISPECIES: SGNH/GDSL hydrolase family protein [Desertifilum]MDA0212106.1 SGNH/GDSL hydrolase family protein [Cyanobacteria bacterium FC1]MBD2314090.1 SGNH/GDSL hydrolase family protein [Desertifilum sp. FACHB-1129]MBD2323575.1 SGNH/GDSL hydrolase family protein [Desertifilum sp. FACHB-866]MBD2335027.1 SGNH/GDSL hydrolase family protein [Desertifilum sp. FACHB-868]OEJ75409.1 lipolytic protein G-D-S-L family [Desertifilum tharense IPPAS B-1220]